MSSSIYKNYNELHEVAAEGVEDEQIDPNLVILVNQEGIDEKSLAKFLGLYFGFAREREKKKQNNATFLLIF